MNIMLVMLLREYPNLHRIEFNLHMLKVLLLVFIINYFQYYMMIYNIIKYHYQVMFMIKLMNYQDGMLKYKTFGNGEMLQYKQQLLIQYDLIHQQFQPYQQLQLLVKLNLSIQLFVNSINGKMLIIFKLIMLLLMSIIKLMMVMLLVWLLV